MFHNLLEWLRRDVIKPRQSSKSISNGEPRGETESGLIDETTGDYEAEGLPENSTSQSPG
jgi:hypothetical protein